MLAGCAEPPAAVPPSAVAKTAVRVVGIKGPTGVSLVRLMQAQDDGTAANDYSFAVASAPEEVAAKVASGDVDIAAVPTNLAAALYAKTSGGVRMLAVNTLGVLYLMENGDTIRSVADLKGRTIYSTGQGANPEFVLRHILTQNGLDPDTDVDLVFKAENEELATLLVTGQAQVALVPEPVVTTVQLKQDKLRVALDMTAEWDKVVTDGSQLMMGAVIARSDFVEKHEPAVRAFLTEYADSIRQATADVEGTAALCEKYGIIPSAAVARQAIPRLNLTYLDGNDLKQRIQGYFQVLHEADPKSVGGAVPDAEFYFAAE